METFQQIADRVLAECNGKVLSEGDVALLIVMEIAKKLDQDAAAIPVDNPWTVHISY